MAEAAKTTEATVEVEEDGVVTVDVSDNPDLAGEEADAALEAAKPTPRPARAAATKPNAADEAAAALTQSLKTAETARSAAEATAASERARADNASRVAQQHEQAANALREQAEGRELTIINNGIESANRDLAAHRAELERASEAGEFGKAADAQLKLAKAAAALDRLEDAKINYEAGTRKTPLTEGRVESAAADDQRTPFEKYVSSFAPASQAWLRAHPDCVPPEVGGDSTRNSKMMAGHYAARAQGFQPNTPDYFRIIEENTGDRAPVSAAAAVIAAGSDDADAAVTQAAAVPKPKPRAQPSAPPSRDPPNGGQRTTRSVTLTRDQQEAAKISFPQLEPAKAFAQYARNLIELESEGKMGRLSH